MEIVKLPRHLTLSIEHNEHKSYYQTVEELIEERGLRRWFPSEDEYRKAVETNELWVIQWYPDTPIGFNIRAAATFEYCIKAAIMHTHTCRFCGDSYDCDCDEPDRDDADCGGCQPKEMD